MSSPYDAAALRQVAVLAYHSSPLAEPGAGDAGGMTVYVRKVAEALATRGIRSDIFTRATELSRPVTELYPGVRVVAIAAGPPVPLSKDELRTYIGGFASGVGAFGDGVARGYDVVHSHYWQSGLAGAQVARAWDVPFVHSQHTLARVKNRFLAPGDAPEPQSRIEGETEVVASADVLIASTDDERRQLATLYDVPQDRLKVVHPGVDRAMFNPHGRDAARAALGLRDEAMIVYVGRIQPLKGLELGIRAVEELAGGLDRPVVFYVVGGVSGSSGARELTRLRALADSLGVSPNVRFAGPTEHTAVPDFYRAADVCVVCSYSESFGLAALEAHACGTPVVGTAVGGLSHIVHDGESGWLVGSRDPRVFAGRLARLLRDPELWRRFSARASEAVAPFSWEATATGLLDLYDCLVREDQPQLCTG